MGQTTSAEKSVIQSSAITTTPRVGEFDTGICVCVRSMCLSEVRVVSGKSWGYAIKPETPGRCAIPGMMHDAA